MRSSISRCFGRRRDRPPWHPAYAALPEALQVGSLPLDLVGARKGATLRLGCESRPPVLALLLNLRDSSSSRFLRATVLPRSSAALTMAECWPGDAVRGFRTCPTRPPCAREMRLARKNAAGAVILPASRKRRGCRRYIAAVPAEAFRPTTDTGLVGARVELSPAIAERAAPVLHVLGRLGFLRGEMQRRGSSVHADWRRCSANKRHRCVWGEFLAPGLQCARDGRISSACAV